MIFSPSKRIRKQVYDLTAADLDRAAVWEYCLDEEAEASQDEATVKPRSNTKTISSADGMLIAKAEFTFADGHKATGYISASGKDTLPAIQPVVITPRGQVGFWYGIFVPKTAQKAEALSWLGSVTKSAFPIRFSSLVLIDGVFIQGQLEGFYHFDREHRICLIKA